MFLCIVLCHRILNIVPCAIQWDFVVYRSVFNSLHLLIPSSQSFPPSPLGNHKSVLFICYHILFKKKNKTYLAVPGLSCSTQDLQFSLWHAGSLAVPCKLLVAGWGISFPDQGLNQGPVHWERRVLATGPPGSSTICSFRNFEIYNTVLLTVLIMLYIITLELIYLITGRLFLWPLSHFPTFGNNKSDHFVWDFFRFYM